MPQLSLTDFVVIMSSNGTPKATKVKQVKYRPPYNPATDFYKRIRENIIDIHRNDYSKTDLDKTLIGLTDKKKKTAYPEIIAGYKKWWGKKKLKWFEPPNELFSSHGVDISVKPELGLQINGTPHLIKLYFRGDPLAKNKIDIIIHLMSAVLSKSCPSPSSTVMSVLDVRRSKLISPTVSIPMIDSILDAEMAYISTLWKTL